MLILQLSRIGKSIVKVGILGAANIAKKNIRAMMLADPSLIGVAGLTIDIERAAFSY